MLFELNYVYYPCMFFERDTNFGSYLKIGDKLATKLPKFLAVCHENLYHTHNI